MDFDIIPYEDIVWGKKLGAGSFGSVYKGSYLGIDIAIKEVLPSREYDVHKYFEREWRIMRECRHPNIVLFLGLSKAPGDDSRVFIISEFVPRGNLRQAVAYLHARQCIHRDLKEENLLITSNERVKVTDFGFARIASRNAEEMRRMTYCGTDGYMSPEIINGLQFDLPTDVFSLGIIFIEILSRKLVDSKTYTRTAPSFTPDPDEVRRRASPGCPPDFIELALQCCLERPDDRPLMTTVLAKLREIELEVLHRTDESAEHVGSIRLIHHPGNKRGMPIFDPPGVDTHETGIEAETIEEETRRMEQEALETLSKLDLGGGGASTMDSEVGTWRTARWDEAAFEAFQDDSDIKAHQRLIPSNDTYSSLASDHASSPSAYSTDVVRAKPVQGASVFKSAEPYDGDAIGSTMTVKGISTVSDPMREADIQRVPKQEKAGEALALGASEGKPHKEEAKKVEKEETKDDPPKSQIETIPSLPSSKLLPTPGGKDQTGGGTHRFTLVDKDAVSLMNGKKASAFSSNFAFAFLRTQLEQLAPTTAKCPVCAKRMGQRPALRCDDCNVLVHVKCSHAAARDCTGGHGLAMGN